jgi:NADPH-dependent 2,4-dienoyl-CoA reductase/sulfur reductase-like enzyme
MTSVCVIGGGTAGGEAAREASKGGARVTIIERSEEQDPPWRFWPELIRRSSVVNHRSSTSSLVSGKFGATLVPAEARSVREGYVQTKDGNRMRYDSIIAATGCGFEPTFFPGYRKPGVYILDGASMYAELGRLRDSFSEVAVRGEGVRALQVAGQLCGNGRKVRILPSFWKHGEPSQEVRAVLLKAAEERGASTTKGILGKASGSGSLEAVVVEGIVIPCDALAILPKRIPRVIPTEARIGREGGILIDHNLRSSSPSIFAAGGCAELSAGSLSSMTLEDSAAMSGRIAGANSVGHRLAIDPVRSTVVSVFGLRWTRMGTGVTTANVHGRPATMVSQRLGSTSACTIVFERVSGRVLGIEAVEEMTSAPFETPPIQSGAVSLRTLAYGCSSDISLVSDTARLGMSA